MRCRSSTGQKPLQPAGSLWCLSAFAPPMHAAGAFVYTCGLWLARCSQSEPALTGNGQKLCIAHHPDGLFAGMPCMLHLCNIPVMSYNHLAVVLYNPSLLAVLTITKGLCLLAGTVNMAEERYNATSRRRTQYISCRCCCSPDILQMNSCV